MLLGLWSAITSRLGIVAIAAGIIGLTVGWAAIEHARATSAGERVKVLSSENESLHEDVETLQSAYLALGDIYARRDEELAAERHRSMQRYATISRLRDGCLDTRLPDDLRRVFGGTE